LKQKSVTVLFQIAMKNVVNLIALQNVNVQKSQDLGKKTILALGQVMAQDQALTNVGNQDVRWKKMSLLHHQ